MYDVGSKLLNGIRGMYVTSLACVRVKVRVSASGLIVVGDRAVSCPLGF